MKNKRIISLSLLLTLGISSASAAPYFGQGGAHNGDELRGRGERIADGKDLQWSDVNRTVAACLAEQIHPVIETIWNVSLPKPVSSDPSIDIPPLGIYDQSFRNTFGRQALRKTRQAYVSFRYRSFNQESHLRNISSTIYAQHPKLGVGVRTPYRIDTNASFDFFIPSINREETVVTLIAEGISILYAQSVAIPQEYDALGNPAAGKLLFKAVNVRLYPSKQAISRFKNNAFNSATKYEFNNREYENCLRSRIAAIAAQVE